MSGSDSLVETLPCACFDAPYKVAPECPTHGSGLLIEFCCPVCRTTDPRMHDTLCIRALRAGELEALNRSPVAGERAGAPTPARSNGSPDLVAQEFCPTCGCAVAADKSGHMLYGGRLSYTDFETILLSLGASGSDVKRLWPGDVDAR